MSAALVAVLCAPTGRGETGPSVATPEDLARDAALAEGVRAGTQDAFETLFKTYAEPLTRYAASYTHDLDAAGEIIADVFAALWTGRASWYPTHGVATYLYGAVRNRSLNYERSRQRRAQWTERVALEPELPGAGAVSSADDDHHDDMTDIITRVRAALSSLPPSRREAMILRWDHQMTPDQIAQVMGLSRTAVYHLLERALNTLRELLGPSLR